MMRFEALSAVWHRARPVAVPAPATRARDGASCRPRGGVGTGARAWRRACKRLFDIVGAMVLLVLLSPFMLWVAWRIRREDGAPVLFEQLRVGRGGAEFRFFKFRTMVRDADALLARWPTDQPELYRRYVAHNFKLPDDPRVMAVGRWLRRSSLDELPQLLNVLRGEMSLVGPRPLLARELPDYAPEALACYASVRPGITGLWQVSGRSRTSFAERAACDLRYVEQWSLAADLIILLKTWRVVWRRDGAW